MGSIQQRQSSNGKVSYRAQVRLRGANSVSKTFGTLTKARNWVQEVEVEIKNGGFVITEAKRHTLSELIDLYLLETTLSRKSPEGPTQTLTWWRQEIGYLTLDRITTPLIRQIWDRLAKTPSPRTGKLLSNRTLNGYIETLSAMFTTAVREYGWIKENPVTNLRKKPLKNQRIRALSEEELISFLTEVRASSNPYLLLAVSISLSTGARRSEVMSLTWDDVNLENGRVIFHDTKNGETRALSLGENSLYLLKEHSKVRQIHTRLLFPARQSKRVLHRSKSSTPWEDLRKPFLRACTDAKIKDFRWHDLRHCAATYMLAAGAGLGEVGKILGHKTPQMTWRYAHLVSDRADELVLKVDRKLGSG